MRLFVKSTLTAGLLAAASAAPAFGQATTLFSESFEGPDASMSTVQLASAGISGINQFGDTSQTNITSFAASDGLQSLQIFGPFGGGGTGFTSNALPATAGDTVVAEVNVQTPSGDAAPLGSDGVTIFRLDFFDATGAPAGTEAAGNAAENFNFFTESVGRDFNSVLDLFETLTLTTGPAPDNTASVQLTVVRLNDGNQGGSQFFDELTVTSTPIPEPASLALLGVGGLALVTRRRRA